MSKNNIRWSFCYLMLFTICLIPPIASDTQVYSLTLLTIWLAFIAQKKQLQDSAD